MAIQAIEAAFCPPSSRLVPQIMLRKRRVPVIADKMCQQENVYQKAISGHRILI
jgi:hypothetical protein